MHTDSLNQLSLSGPPGSRSEATPTNRIPSSVCVLAVRKLLRIGHRPGSLSGFLYSTEQGVKDNPIGFLGPPALEKARGQSRSRASSKSDGQIGLSMSSLNCRRKLQAFTAALRQVLSATPYIVRPSNGAAKPEKFFLVPNLSRVPQRTAQGLGCPPPGQFLPCKPLAADLAVIRRYP